MVKNSVFDSSMEKRPDNRQVAQVNTHGGHRCRRRSPSGNIEILEAEKLTERSAEVGAYLLDGLRTLMKHPVVGDVRGKRLWWVSFR